MTLAHFGFGPKGALLDDVALPVTLLGDWREREGNSAKPFPAFARMLASRGTSVGESDFSWTIDFAARRAKARDDMAPYVAEVERRKLEAVGYKERLTALGKSNASDAVLATCREALAAAEKAARDAQARADAIDATVYDLKAVNPRTHVVRDNRTSAEIIESITSHGRTVDAALARLKALLAADPIPTSGD